MNQEKFKVDFSISVLLVCIPFEIR